MGSNPVTPIHSLPRRYLLALAAVLAALAPLPDSALAWAAPLVEVPSQNDEDENPAPTEAFACTRLLAPREPVHRHRDSDPYDRHVVPHTHTASDPDGEPRPPALLFRSGAGSFLRF